MSAERKSGSLEVRLLLQEARTQRSYARINWRGVMVRSAPTPRYVLRGIQCDLLAIRKRRALVVVQGAASHV